MKKVLSVLLTLAMIFSLIPMGTFTLTANALTEGYYTYTVSSGKATITDVDTSISGDVTIPSTLGGCPVTSIDRSAFEGCLSITSIAVPDGVTTISEYAFFDCQAMTSITLPDSITSIGNYAFLDTGYYLNEDNWEDNVLYIGKHLIKANSSIIDDCIVKDGTLTIADYAFAFREELTGIVISNSVKNIGECAFGGCAALESITVDSGNTVFHSAGNCIIDTENKVLVAGCKNSVIPTDNNVTSIGDYAFYGNYEITSITIPDNITSIGWCSFAECGGLTEITIPGSITSIGEGAFEECAELVDVWYSGTEEDKENISFADGNDYLLNATWHYDEDNDEKYYTYTVTDGKATITAVDTSISGDVTIPSTLGGYPVTSIGYGAFMDCTGLEVIIIPDGVTSIGSSAFFRCSNLTSINIPDGVTSIGTRTFYNCAGLTSIIVPDSVTVIGEAAFEGCYSIKKITLPFVGEYEEEYAPYSQLSRLFYVAPDMEWDDGTDDDPSSYVPSALKEVVITKATIIGREAFKNCSNITNITIPNTVTSIYSSAFSGCTGLVDVWYSGTEEDKENISFADGNDYLLNATWHYGVCTEHTYSNYYDSICNVCEWERDDAGIPTSTFLLEIQQNILGITSFSYESFDMNNDKKVDAIDIAIIQALILGL